MSASRTEIMAAIRNNLGETAGDPQADYEAIPRNYIVKGKLDPESRLRLFEERLHDYGSAVSRCAQDQLQQTITQVLAARKISRILVAPEFPDAWLPSQSITFVRDSGFNYGEMDRSAGVLTACAAAIALTGTIILHHSPTEGRRALTLVPDYHLCVVHADQVVETVPEAIRRMEPFKMSPITTISGSSATSDIEMTRIKGVHGPRTLDVILITSQASIL
jgi:L-lactate dehydrogenase complex protein LldG